VNTIASKYTYVDVVPQLARVSCPVASSPAYVEFLVLVLPNSMTPMMRYQHTVRSKVPRHLEGWLARSQLTNLAS
jgi:hypothetical protein